MNIKVAAFTVCEKSINTLNIYFVFIEEELSGSKELENLAENFREQASKLVDMLDISIPVVSKLKV